MATITSTGVGSGLDVNTIVSSLMSVEKRPLQQLQAQAGTLQTRVSAYGQLQSQLSALGDVAARLGDPAAWRPMRAEAADPAMATVAAAAGARAGSHALEVTRLAQPQVLSSGWFGSAQAELGTGTLTIELGTTSAGGFMPRSGTALVSIEIGAGQQTLAGVRDAINAAKAGVTASIITGPEGAKLVLRGADGADSSVRLRASADADGAPTDTVGLSALAWDPDAPIGAGRNLTQAQAAQDADGASTDAAGLSALAWDPDAPVGAGRNLTQAQAAQDAAYTLDGVSLTSPSNTASGALEGVTLTLRKVTSGPVQITLAVEANAVRKNVNDFVSAYNALNTLLRNQTQADPTGKNRGPLQADSTAVALLIQLRGMLQGVVAGATGASSLSAAGLAIQRDGSLLVTESRLGPLLQDPAQLATLFGQAGPGDAAGRGIGLRFKDWARALTGESGALATRVGGLKRTADLNQKRQDQEGDRLARTEARLRAQYQRLDNQMSELNARMTQMKSSLGLG